MNYNVLECSRSWLKISKYNREKMNVNIKKYIRFLIKGFDHTKNNLNIDLHCSEQINKN